MYLYNVTINVNTSIEEEWLAWMRDIHIPDMLQTGKFYSARLCKVLVDEDTGGVTYAVQYTCPDYETLQQYYDEDASTMRADGINRFGEQTVAFRTELEIIDDKVALPEAATTRLFVYGTLMDSQVQEMVLNRSPEQEKDHIKGAIRRDMKVAGLYPDIEFTPGSKDVIDGLSLLINKHELPLLDHYEGSAYRRVEVTLGSGKTAWVYIGSDTEYNPG